MTVSSSPLSSRRRYARLAALVLGCALVTPGFVRAQDDNAPPRELEERTSQDLDKLQPLLDAKNWDAALALIQGIRSRVEAKSYDMAIASDVEAKLYLQKGELSKAIAPWEQALQLGDAYKFFDQNSQQERVYYLAQLCYQEATESKSPAQQKQNFAKAIKYLERWLAQSKKPPFDPARAEAQMFFANVLYQQGVLNPDKPDMELVKRAGEQIERALRTAVRPKEGSFLILLAVAQQNNDWVKLGEILELLVKQYPGKKDYWSQLVGVYGTLAAQEKDPDKAREYNTRAITAMERAQALGFMKTPKDYYSLFGMYFNVGQFGRATEILHAGLRDGSIEQDLKNWELLASSYQQVDKPFAAIEALMEGTKKFPKSGQLDYSAATIYYSLNKPNEAYKHIKDALVKGNLDKPGGAYGFLAYVAWELGKLEEALAAADKALTFPDAQKDTQLPRLKNAIQDALREREAATKNVAAR
ncbi:tetratricopeptide repeat protein [Opitutus terrae]|uniref:tetratricopeptide repeat protein n=1 Tax=Opitutus terrae TaxID=107709 RepID=UPI0011D15D4B|nr:tetratricopeptide repeat protein [Opitutus terrae]